MELHRRYLRIGEKLEREKSNMLFERFENSGENIRLFGMFVAVLIVHSLYCIPYIARQEDHKSFCVDFQNLMSNR